MIAEPTPSLLLRYGGYVSFNCRARQAALLRLRDLLARGRRVVYAFEVDRQARRARAILHAAHLVMGADYAWAPGPRTWQLLDLAEPWPQVAGTSTVPSARPR